MFTKSIAYFLALLLSIIFVENNGYANPMDANVVMTFSINRGPNLKPKSLPIVLPAGFVQVFSDYENFWFVPEGETLENWTQLFTIQITDSESPPDYVLAMKEKLEKTYGLLVTQSKWQPHRKHPRLLTLYSYDGPTADVNDNVISGVNELMRVKALLVDLGVVVLTYSERYTVGSLNQSEKDLHSQRLWNVIELTQVDQEPQY